MKKITSALFFLVPLLGISQSAEQRIQTYLDANKSKLGLSQADVSDWFVESTLNSESTKIDNYFIKQRVNGTEVFRAVSNVWIKNGQVVNIGDQFVPNASLKTNASNPQLSVLQALGQAIGALHLENQNFSISETISNKNYVISNGSLDPIHAELVYQQMQDGNLRLAWDFEIDVPKHLHLWSVRIDAISGELLEQNDRVISCSFESKEAHAAHTSKPEYAFAKDIYKPESFMETMAGTYRVVPFNIESPAHGPRQLISNPEDLTASPWGWHDTNGATGAEFTYTRGNNVFACEDRDGNNGTGYYPTGGASLLFDFPYGGTNVAASTYLDAAITNLFYMNNAMHDVWYRYGFNEANGNFQQNNYGRGGVVTFQGDAVQADAQDGAALTTPNLNNANFSSPQDGVRPRMQMYLWNVTPSPFTINSPASIAGSIAMVDNSFNPGHVNVPVTPNIIQSDLVLFNDGSPDTSDACSAPINAAAIAGHITVVRRGTCTFVEKVLFAQNAGATAVIVVNNEPGYIGMAGADASITIPAVAISQEDGEAIIAQMANGPVAAQLQSSGFVNADGDLDNCIVAHEYGHGISGRLTGGPTNAGCLDNAEQAGEGWSDWFALMMQLKVGDVGTTPHGIAAFSSSQPLNGGGIRTYPYSTDMSVNPLTFINTNTTITHDRGEFMAAVLWDLTWAYIDKYGHDANVFSGTGGNNKVMRLVIDALKLQPCSPTFVEYRDALIAADNATTGGNDYCTIWNVFARRGLGVNASSGGRNSATDQVQDFSKPAACQLGATEFNEDMFRVYPNPSKGTVNVRIGNYTGKLGVRVVDINGRVVFQNPNIDFNVETTLNLHNLQTGMYVLKVNGESFTFSKKLILN
ncbi:T9SS-dependent M36 family metallopeptidase [Flavobacterium sp.]|uniref:T9SS-dependent M36 family metallopeptidase n=1 Tax=Flavobacterium sp. TaxID=239 RepID=UPI00122A718C|nr:T9SS-dependent M36 family metallopeptidase [Flavobacterium sp.]RZJ73914.1 MAG: T9SS type A sorting domain-containing protein [Flavobacterium sp.]